MLCKQRGKRSRLLRQTGRNNVTPEFIAALERRVYLDVALSNRVAELMKKLRHNWIQNAKEPRNVQPLQKNNGLASISSSAWRQKTRNTVDILSGCCARVSRGREKKGEEKHEQGGDDVNSLFINKNRNNTKATENSKKYHRYKGQWQKIAAVIYFFF